MTKVSMEEQVTIERILADALRARSASGTHAAVPTVGSALARLLDSYLREQPSWQFRWVDDLLDQRVDHLSGGVIEVSGSMVWGERGRSEQWTDPFLASFTLSDDGNEVERYVLRFGDANAASVPYDKRRRSPGGDHSRTWSFVFQK